MFSSETISTSRDFLHSNPTSQTNFKHVSAEGEFLKSREFMGSDFFNSHQQQQQQSSGLARYRSAPSSFLAALLDSNADNSSSGDESDAFFSALMDAPPRDLNPKSSTDNNNSQISCSSLKREDGAEAEPRPGYSNVQMGGYEGAVVGSYSVGMEHHVNVGLRDGNGNHRSNQLVRQSSSPAGFFNGYGVMGEVGNYRVHNHAEDSSAGGLSSSMNMSSAPSSSSRFMPSIPESGNENENIGTTTAPENVRLRNGDSVNGRDYEAAAFQHDSWNESTFNNLKRNRDGDLKIFSNFNGLENQNGDTRKKSSGLVSHFSLPKTSTEMAAVENFLQFQQETTTPCQVRAKRGFATHPRSIAERMRRTRISKNMKKLQDLFPNMDKQTNTADMLDLAVDYIKELQKEMQTLKDAATKCVCSSKPQQTSPTA